MIGDDLPPPPRSADDYASLVPPLHRGKPRFMAFLREVAVAGHARLQLTLAGLPRDFDLDEAVGAQLDRVGERVGQGRQIDIPLDNLWFELDNEERGLDIGLWFNPAEPANARAELDDEAYRILLRAVVAANHWDGTMIGLRSVLNVFLAGTRGVTVLIDDRQDMSMVIGFVGTLDRMRREIARLGFLRLKAGGVAVEAVVNSAMDTPLFGLDLDTPLVAGLDIGSWAEPL